MKILLGGLVVAAMAYSNVEARQSDVERGLAGSGGTPPATAQLFELAWTQKFIRVGPGSNTDRWKCSVAINGAVYFSTGFIESSARQKLATRTGKPPICRRTDREFIGLGIGF